MEITITKITNHKRYKQRYHLFIDKGNGEEYGFSVDEDVLIKKGIRKGLKITHAELEKIIDEDEMKKTYHLAIHYLSYRIRSIEEMRKYLNEKGRMVKHIELVIKKLIEEHLLDDRDFAERYISTKKNTQLKGPNKVKQELVQKGVNSSIIEQALLNYSFSEQVEKVKNWLEKQKYTPRESLQATKTKWFQRLLTKGFSQEVINEAFSLHVFDGEHHLEENALYYQAEKLKKKYSLKYNSFEYEQKMKQALYRKGFSLELIQSYLEQDK
ncbi:recombination regulator RecX [Alkalihalobacillus trypoxylicola]|uniref:Regulatory protein RecX n=1 Tax=Alkalihalobacillus trypoxylicola TaxID=519424 RepID=A0A161P798_9BACI|nr:recombination regulator RecX [Alkalihalobacillus trypoxylicola]KYG26951.1 recombinase RecX [Alkalihalobacillus trypoxylicola]